MKTVKNSIKDLTTKIIKNIPKITLINLVFVTIVSFFSVYTFNSVKDDIYYEEIHSKSKLYQTFLDSTAGKMENLIFEKINEDHTNESTDLDNLKEIQNECIYGLNEIDENLKLYTFAIEYNTKTQKEDLYIVINDVVYKVFENNNKYVLVNRQVILESKYSDEDIMDLLKYDYNIENLTNEKVIITDKVYLNSVLINRMKNFVPTDYSTINDFKSNDDKTYFYNLSIMPRYTYFDNEDHTTKRKIGFLAVYNEDYITNTLQLTMNRINRAQNVFTLVLFINAIMSMLLLVYSNVMTKFYRDNYKKQIKKCNKQHLQK